MLPNNSREILQELQDLLVSSSKRENVLTRKISKLFKGEDRLFKRQYFQSQFNAMLTELLEGVLDASNVTDAVIRDLQDRLDEIREDIADLTKEQELFMRNVQLGHATDDAEIMEEAEEPSDLLWDSMELSFQDRFRGGPDLIKSRMSAYLEDLRALRDEGLTVLDLGCGRGDWLELMRDNGIDATGVDLDARSVERAQQKGLDVVQGDVITHLEDIKANSIDVVTAFHLVEHLPTDALLNLLHGAWRVLKIGGLLILETPNPENLVVSTNTFYLDPTHRNPIPPPLLEFLVERTGFSRVEIRRLRHGDSVDEQCDEMEKRLRLPTIFQEFLNSSKDYAVLAIK